MTSLSSLSWKPAPAWLSSTSEAAGRVVTAEVTPCVCLRVCVYTHVPFCTCTVTLDAVQAGAVGSPPCRETQLPS